MKKYFTSFVAAGTVASFVAACHKKAKPKATTTDKKDTKKTEAKDATSSTLKKGTTKKGQFKIGVVGSDDLATTKLKALINSYTQDVEDATKVGKNYFELSSGLELKSSKKFNAGHKDNVILEQVASLNEGLKTVTPFAMSKKHRTNSKWDTPIGEMLKWDSKLKMTYYRYSGGPSLLTKIDVGLKDPIGANFVNNFLTLYEPYSFPLANTVPTNADYDAIFTNSVLYKIYQNLESTNPTGQQLYEAFKKAGINPDAKYEFWSGKNLQTKRPWYVPLSEGAEKTGRIYFNKAKLGNKINELGNDALQVTKTFKELTDTFKEESRKGLSDKTQLASKNLDALFVQVTDGVENDEKVYKTVVDKKEFKNTHLFFIGDKAKSQSGSSSKTFAGGKVSTASYDKYAATYIAGFQAAVGTLKYSTSEDSFVETSVAFLIGADGESDSKKKAFAFRRGVEAAKNHPAYSKYLKVKFVSKTEDSSKASKKLFREVSEWKEKSDSKTKLYQFTSSDTFSDAERRVIYLAGTTARDWIGQTKTKLVDFDQEDVFWKGDDLGLIGALYNAKKPSALANDDPNVRGEPGESFDSLTDKTYSRNVWVVLDKAYGKTWTADSNNENDWHGFQNDKGELDSAGSTNGVLSNKHNLTQVYEASKDPFKGGRRYRLHRQVGLNFERKEVKFYGAVGQESEGTKVYAKHALKALFMGGVNYMVGKHTIFGASLDVSLTKNAGKAAGNDAWAKFEKNTPWSLPKDDVSLKDKNKARYEDSLSHAWEKELSKDALVKESAWLK